jgi:MscS family membrane protein
LLVNIEDFTDFSVKILVYALIRTTDWVESRKVQDDIMLEIMKIIEAHGAECPFPTTIMQIPNEVKFRQLEAGDLHIAPLGRHPSES